MRPPAFAGLLLLVTLGVAPAHAAILDPPPGEAPPQETQEPAPSSNPIDPEGVKGEVEGTVEDVLGEDDAIAPSPGGDGGSDYIGQEVTEVLAENWLLTALITGGLMGALFAAWTLASRYLDPTVALQSPERSMLYGFIKGNPGVHLKQLSTEFAMKTSTVLWHVRKLQHADLVRSKKANGYRIFYPVSGGLEASRLSEAVTALSNENARAVFVHLLERPGRPVHGLTDELDVNGGTLRWHLKKLRQAGLVEETPGDPKRAPRPTELGLKAWAQVQGVPAASGVPVTPVATRTEIEVAG